MSRAVHLRHNLLQSSSRNLSKKENTLIKHKDASHALHCVTFLFAFGHPPVSFQYRFTISFAFAILSSAYHVLFFSSQPSHFTSYSQLVLMELARYLASHSTKWIGPAWLVDSNGGSGHQTTIESSMRSTLSLPKLTISYIAMKVRRSSSGVFPRIRRIWYGPM